MYYVAIAYFADRAGELRFATSIRLNIRRATFAQPIKILPGPIRFALPSEDRHRA